MNRDNCTAIVGYAIAAMGVLVFTQADRVSDLRTGSGGRAAAVGLVTTLTGFIVALIGSILWNRRTRSRQPIVIALAIGLGSWLLAWAIDANVHGPSAILMFVFLFSAVNVVAIGVCGRWRK
jgi:hypothetical protein